MAAVPKGRCPICRRKLPRYGSIRVPDGGIVHRGQCELAERDRIEAHRRRVEQSGRWLPLSLSKQHRASLEHPPLVYIKKVINEPYLNDDVLRLIARNDRTGYAAALRIVQRLWDLQTPEEKRRGDAIVRNMQGFNAPDSSIAKRLLQESRRQGYSKWLHFRLAELLLKYMRTQVPEIMLKGVQLKGYKVVANPYS